MSNPLTDLIGFFTGDSSGSPGDVSSLGGDTGALTQASDALSSAGGAAADGGLDLGSLANLISGGGSSDTGLSPLAAGDSSSQPFVMPVNAGDGSGAVPDPGASLLGTPFGSGGTGSASYGYTPLAQLLDTSTGSGGAPELSTIQKIMKGLGLSGDLSDPKVMQSWMKLIMGGGGFLQALLRGNKSLNYKSPMDLRSSMVDPAFNNWTPAQAASASAYFGGATPSWQSRPMVYSGSRMPAAVGSGATHLARGGLVRYCEGGKVYE